MFNTLRYAYHLIACEKIIKSDYSAYELNKRYKWYKRKLNKLMTQINNKQKRA